MDDKDGGDMSGAAEFFAMGGHGPYVWSAWGLAVLALAANLFAALADKRRARKDARARREGGD